MRKTSEIFGKNRWTFNYLLYLLLVFFGWINIYISMYNDDFNHTIYNLDTKHGKQLFFIGISIIVGFVILIIDWSFFDSLALLFYLISILFLIIVLFSLNLQGVQLHGSD